MDSKNTDSKTWQNLDKAKDAIENTDSIQLLLQNGKNGHLAGLREALNIIRSKTKEEAIEELKQIISCCEI